MNPPVTLLVIDDDPAVRDVFASLLRRDGYAVRLAATGREGLEMTRRLRPALVLLDVELPDARGTEVCREIKADASLRDVFVVMISGQAVSPESKVDGLERGADEYLTKPIGWPELRARIRACLRLRDTAAALRRSEETLRAFLDALPDSAALIGCDGTLRLTNRRLAQRLGAASEELVGKNVASLFPPDLVQQRQAHFDAVVRTGQPRQFEDARGGHHYLNHFNPVLDDAGAVTHVAVLALDITERKASEDALRRSVSLFRATLESTADGILVLDLAGRIVEFNARFAEMWQLPDGFKDACKGCDFLASDRGEQPLQGLLDQLIDPEEFLTSVRKYCAQPDLSGLDRLEFKDGRVFERFSHPQYIAGAPVGRVWSFRNVTRRVVAERALQDRLRYLRTLMDAIPLPLFSTDGAGRYTGCNKAFEEFLGLPEPQLIGRTAQQIAPGALSEPYQRADRQLLDNPGTQSYEATVAHPDGTRRDVLFTKASFQDAEGKTAGLVGAMVDFTARKRSEEMLLRIQKALDASSVAVGMATQEGIHFYQNEAFTKLFGWTVKELNQPMGPLRVYADPEAGRAMFKTIMSGAPWQGEVEMVTKSGRRFPVALQANAVQDAQGRIIGLVGLHTDISEPKRAERQRAVFAGLGHHLSQANTAKEAAQTIMDSAIELFGGDAGYVSLYSAAQDLLTPVIAFDTVEGRKTPVPPETLRTKPTAMVRMVLAEGARLLNRSPGSSAPVKFCRFGNVKRRSASLMFASIRSQDECVGLLSLQSYTPKAFSEADLRLLRSLAGLCGGALRRIHLGEALRQAEGRYRSIFENATEGMFQSRPDGRGFITANTALAKMLGYATPEQFMRETHDVRQLYLVPEQRDQFRRQMEAEGEVRDFEVQVRCRDGGFIWASVNAHVVRDAQGTILYFEGTNQDITQRKVAQNELARSQRLQASLLRNITDPAWLKDREGRFLACNEALGAFYGLELERVVGKTVLDLSPQEAERLRREDEVVMLSGKPAQFEASRTDAQGTSHWFETVKSPVFNERNEVIGTVGIARDITERKWAESQLRQQRDLGLALSASNELKAAAEGLVQSALQNEGIDCAGLYLVNREEGGITLAAQQGMPRALLRRFFHFARGSYLRLRRPRSPGPTVFSEAEAGKIEKALRRTGFPNVEIIPIRTGKQVVAALCVCSRQGRMIPQRSRHVIEAVVLQVGDAIARIQTEQALRNTRQLNERMLASLRAGVFVLDAALNTIIECNPAATHMFGYGYKDLVGQSVSMLHLIDSCKIK